MIIRILSLLIFLSFYTHLVAQEKCCDWVAKEILPTAPQKCNDTLTYEHSLAQWERDKNKHNNSYSYLMGSSNNYTQIEVENGMVISRKHYSIQKELKETEWICQPDLKSCLYQKKIDSLRKIGNKKYLQMIQEHSNKHTIHHFELNFFNCWEEHNEFVSKNDRSAFPAKTMDELYEECRKTLQKTTDPHAQHVKLSHSFHVNSDGYICSCYVYWPDVVMDAESVNEGFEIISFQWKEDSSKNVHNRR